MTEDRKPDGKVGSAKDGFFLTGIGAMGSFLLVMLIGAGVLGVGFAPSAAERAAASETRNRTIQPGDAAKIFSERCASCHGVSGKGRVGPSFDGVSERYETAELQEAIVREGKNNMPAFEGVLFDEQIAAVVAYERDVLDGG